MAKIISRLFPDQKAAKAVEKQLRWARFPSFYVRVVHGEGLSADAARAKLLSAEAPESVADHYAKKLAGGASAVVVRAGYKPLNAPRITREIMAGSKAIETGLEEEEIRVPDKPEPASSVLKEHPRFLTRAPDPYGEPARPVTEGMGWKMLLEHRTKRSVISGGRFMSRAFWPQPLLSTKSRKSSVISGGRRMSKMFWPQKLISSARRRNSVIRDGDTPFSRVLGLPLLAGRYDS